MKLYFAPGACSLSPHIVLREAGLTFDLESASHRAIRRRHGPGIGTYPARRQQRALPRPGMGQFHLLRTAQELQPLFRPNTPDDYKPIAKDNLANRFAFVDNHLSDRPYLVGDKFTVADAYLFTILNWAKFQSINLAPWPNLLKFMARVGERPNVKEALRAEGLA